MQLSLQVANSLHFCCKPLGTTHESYATNKSDEVSPNHLLQEQSVLWGWKTFQIVLYAQGNAKFWYIACARGKKRRYNELAWDCGWKNLKRQVRRWCSRWDFGGGIVVSRKTSIFSSSTTTNYSRLLVCWNYWYATRIYSVEKHWCRRRKKYPVAKVYTFRYDYTI